MQFSPTKIVGLFAVSAVLIGAAVFVTGLLFGRSLESDVRRMIATMASLDTVVIKTEFVDEAVDSLPLFPLPAEQSSVAFGAQGGVDLTDKPDLQFVQKFAIKTSVDGAEMSGEYRDLKNANYLYLTEAPNYDDVDLTAFAKEWIVIPQGFSFGALTGEEAPKELTTEDLDALFVLLDQIDLVDVQRTGIVEIIDGDATLPYDFVIDQEGMTTFLVTWFEMRHGVAIDPASYQIILDQVESLGEINGTLWIGRKSFLLHRLTAETSEVDLKMTFKDFNQPVDLSPPSTSKDIRDVLGELGFNVAALPSSGGGLAGGSGVSTEFGALPGSGSTADSKNTDPDGDGLDNGYERFYGTDPNHPDTDGDGQSDGYEVEHSTNPRGTGSIFSFGLPQ